MNYWCYASFHRVLSFPMNLPSTCVRFKDNLQLCLSGNKIIGTNSVNTRFLMFPEFLIAAKSIGTYPIS